MAEAKAEAETKTKEDKDVGGGEKEREHCQTNDRTGVLSSGNVRQATNVIWSYTGPARHAVSVAEVPSSLLEFNES